jgi:hypothetical protein
LLLLHAIFTEEICSTFTLNSYVLGRKKKEEGNYKERKIEERERTKE